MSGQENSNSQPEQRSGLAAGLVEGFLEEGYNRMIESPDLHSGKEPSMLGQIDHRLEPRSSAILLTDGAA
jgi:hypothetical protein